LSLFLWTLVGFFGVLIALIFVYAHWIEPTMVRGKRYQFWHVDLPEALDGTRLLVFADLHFKGHGKVEERKIDRIVERSQELPGDVYLFLGDFIHDDRGLAGVQQLLQRLPDGSQRLAVLGNHDYVTYELNRIVTQLLPDLKAPGHIRQRARRVGRRLYRIGRLLLALAFDLPLRAPTRYNDTDRLRRDLAEARVHLLRNSVAVWPEGKSPHLYFVGIDDVVEGTVADLPALPSSEPFGILLTHNPDGVLLQDWNGVKLVLTGHTHGGQMVLPWIGAVHSQGTHLGRRRASGWQRSQGRWLFVTCGLGESFPFRFCCRPELVQIELRRGCHPITHQPAGWHAVPEPEKA